MSGPKIKFTEEKLVNKTYEFINEFGIEKVNARELAHFIGCSTQPIFRVFNTLDELVIKTFVLIEDTYNTLVEEEMANNKIPFLGIGMGYIRFSVEYPNLFKAMFMSEHFKKATMLSFFETDDSLEIITMISTQTKLTIDKSRKLLRNIWLLTHGIATMLAYNEVSYSQKEITEILGNGFRGFILELKENNNE